MLSARDDVSLVSLDLGEHAYVKSAKAVIDATFPRRHLLLIGDSTVTLPTLLGEFDMYFVDGCHAYDVASVDVRNVLARARPRDLFVLDDVALETEWSWTAGPTRVWKEIVANGLIAPKGTTDLRNGHGWAWGYPTRA